MATTHGATPAPLPSGPPSPGPHSHGDPILLDQFVTSASPFGRNQVDLAQATTVLSGRNLLLKQQPTLGETLSSEPGVSATSFGPGASRPIIRGLGGDRIRLLENSVGTLDASVVSPDHAVSIEPFLVERIEVVRGPASLLYGSSAVGGAVNVITHRIEDELPEARVRGAAEVRFGSAAEEWSRGGLLDVVLRRDPERALVLHLDGFKRSTEDVRIPGFAESARLRREETIAAAAQGEAPPGFAHGRLPNSALRSDGGAAGLSFVGPTFHVGANHSGVNTNYGVPGHGHDEASDSSGPGTRIDLRQRRTDVQAAWRGEDGAITGARLKIGHATYRHVEFEAAGVTGTTFANKGYDARAEVLHGGSAPGWSGALGAQSTRSDFSATGAEAFLPASVTRSEAVFAFEEITRQHLTWQFGARLEQTRIAPEEGAGRRDREVSGSLGVIWKIDEADSVALSLAHTGRAPNTQELFAHGPHAGTQSFEIGDASLRVERSLGAEVSFRRRLGFVTGAVTVFANHFAGYIFEQPTGLVARDHEGGWEFERAGAGAGTASEDGLPVYRFVQRTARFHGAEFETLWHLHESTGRQFDLKLAGDLTRGRASNGPLPRIPAARVLAGAAWTAGPWSAGVEAQFVLSQRRTAEAEEPSAAYTLLGADASYGFEAGGIRGQWFARASNLTDAEARPHTSLVKEIAPVAGRSLLLGVRLRF